MLRVIEVTHNGDGSHRQRATFTETNAAGDFTVAVSSSSLPNGRSGRETLVVEASWSGADVGVAVFEVAPPRIVQQILERVRVKDGSTTLYSAPRMIHGDSVDEAVGAVFDPDRIAAVVIAGSLGVESDQQLVQLVGSLTKRSLGVATTFVLAADALDAFNVAMPAALQVHAGQVRTFEPGVDADFPEEGFRHRVLGPTTFARNISGARVTESLQKRHAASTRRRIIEAELPRDVRRSLDLLDREATRLEREIRVDARVSAGATIQSAASPEQSAPSADPEVQDTSEAKDRSTPDPGHATSEPLPRSIFRRISSFVRRVSGHSEISESSLDLVEQRMARQEADLQVLQELLDESAAGAEVLRSDLRVALAEKADLELEAAIEADEARKHQRDARILRERLKEAQHFEDTFVAPESDEWAPPVNIQELLLRLADESSPTFGRIVFTGDESTALAIESRDPVGRYAGHFWDYIRVLHDYSIARLRGGFAGSVHSYLTDSSSPAGHKCTPARHASRESDQTMTRWGSERVFPVPEDVVAEGRVVMPSHFKPTNENTFAPRMHYYDDIDNSGKIYVGYIGKHLTNTKTKNS